jgi:hypothetical protein
MFPAVAGYEQRESNYKAVIHIQKACIEVLFLIIAIGCEVRCIDSPQM